MGTVAQVEVAYRAAFEDFSRKAQRVQTLAEYPSGDRHVFEAALLDLEKAHLAYNEARDALIQSMFPPSRQQRSSGRDDHHADIQAIAELLWQSAGRPSGTEKEDWKRAEAIVQRAVAATACAAC